MRTVTFQTGSIGVQTVAVSNGPFGNGGGVSGGFYEMPVSSGSLAVTIVPEPATVLLLAAGGLGLCRVLVRRRKATDAVPAIAA